MIGITILGSTGTIGVNTLDVVARHSDRFRVFALTANKNAAVLLEQCRRHLPRYAVMVDPQAAETLADACNEEALGIEVLCGTDALDLVAAHAEAPYVMAAIVGAAGLMPSLAAARAGKRVLLANKEALVMSGQLFMEAVHANGAELLPIDSEHNAVFQCMPRDFARNLPAASVARIILTASGGPFRRTPLAELAAVTPAQACAHPNWVMGRKISVDSATMMNKGLEIIEACWLFGASHEAVEVLVHPQSIVHSMVEYDDGSVLAQLGNPDMRTPIAYALMWPERGSAGVAPLDLLAVGALEFEAPDTTRFPCLRLAREAMAAGGTAAAILNAANEAAVAAFLRSEVDFPSISRLVEHALEQVPSVAAGDLGVVLDADQSGRASVDEYLQRSAA